MKKVTEILDGWFGEPLENAEDEENLRKNLYEPLRHAFAEEWQRGYDEGYRDRMNHDSGNY